MKLKKLITTAVAACSLAAVVPFAGATQTHEAKATTINSMAKQDSYSGVTYLYKMLQTEGIKYNKFYGNGNTIHYRNGKPEGIVIHETATPNATAHNEAIYFNREWMNMYAYVHAFVDHSSVIQMMTPNYGVWGAGPVANNRFIQVELCEENNRTNFAKGVNNDAIYAAKMLHRYNLKPTNATHTGKGTVWSHHAVSRFLGGTDHTDPDGYFAKWGYSMDQFVPLIQYYYDLQAGSTDKTPKDPSTPATSNTNPNADTDNSTSSSSQAPVGSKKTLMHEAYVYDENGKRTNAAMKPAGTKVTVAGEKTITGIKYLQIGKNQYVVAGNINGSNRKLTHNAYIYDTVGIRVGSSKLYRGNYRRTYGARVTINGKKYYHISPSQFVKVANFR